MAVLLFRRDELHVVDRKSQRLDGLLDQVSILFSDMAEFRRGHAHEDFFMFNVAVAGGLQPSVVGVPVDLFFQRTQDFHPRIDGGGCSSRRKRHDNSSSQGDNFSRGEPSARPTKSHPSNALPAAARKADDLLTSSGSTGGAIL